MVLIITVIKIYSKIIYFDLEKDFSAAFIRGICGTEAETFGKSP